jgi:hypothetical protein
VHTNAGGAVAAYDSVDTVPEFSELRDALRAGDWSTCEEALRAMPADTAAYAIAMIGELDGVEELLQSAVAQAPGSACARTTLAMRYVMIGWAIRTGARSENVSSEQFAAFRTWLVAAEQLLIDACALDAGYAPAWGVRVLTARALEVGASEAWRRFERVRALSPDDLPAQIHMLEYLLPKWAGTDEQARSFAFDSAAQAPPGSPSGMLVPLYHLERWLELDGDEPGREYMRQASVVAELTDAAARSVRHADHPGGPLGIQAHSAFAMALWLADRPEEAAVHFAALDGRATDLPWTYAFDEAAGVAGVRDAILGGRREGAR